MNQHVEKPDRSGVGPNDSDQGTTGKISDIEPGRSAVGGGEPPPDPADIQQVSAYILDMTMALRNVASNAGMDFLAYLLDMAAEESLELSRGTRGTETARPSGQSGRKTG